MHYRKEIDGLRALAVLPVMFFHAGLGFAQGGFIGVDVFFVISGYLISSIIMSELEKGNFSLLRFYERRARRILPALFLVTACCLPVAWAWMTPDQLKAFGKSVIATMLFLSNVHFNNELGYFGPQSAEIPLLHTWSLAVEEQFYLFFPLLLMLLWRFGMRPVWLSIVALALLSLATAEIGWRHDAQANFYLPFSRLCELFAGGLAALYLKGKHAPLQIAGKQIGGTLALIGLAMIVYSIMMFDHETPFPSLYMLVPVLGTVLIIIFASNQTLVANFLSLKPFVVIGLISYSAYLWHQPLFAFAHIRLLDPPSDILMYGLIATSLFLALLSQHFIEQPFRKKSTATGAPGHKTYYFASRIQVFALCAAASLAFIAIGLGLVIGKGVKQRIPDNVNMLLAGATYSPKRTECHAGPSNYIPPKDGCSYLSGNIKWASFGDSHTVETAYELARTLEKDDIGLRHFSFSACMPVQHIKSRMMEPCMRWNKEAIADIIADERIENVVVMYRYSAYLFGMPSIHRAGLPDDAPPIDENWDAETKRQKVLSELEQIVTSLAKHKKRVYLVLPIPEIKANIHNLIYDKWRTQSLKSISDIPGIDIPTYQRRNKLIRSFLVPRNFLPNVTLIDPAPLLCDKTTCWGVRDSVTLYLDDSHVSLAGARLIADEILRQAQGE